MNLNLDEINHFGAETDLDTWHDVSQAFKNYDKAKRTFFFGLGGGGGGGSLLVYVRERERERASNRVNHCIWWLMSKLGTVRRSPTESHGCMKWKRKLVSGNSKKG